jgi:hypothetical protein
MNDGCQCRFVLVVTAMHRRECVYQLNNPKKIIRQNTTHSVHECRTFVLANRAPPQVHGVLRAELRLILNKTMC